MCPRTFDFSVMDDNAAHLYKSCLINQEVSRALNPTYYDLLTQSKSPNQNGRPSDYGTKSRKPVLRNSASNGSLRRMYVPPKLQRSSIFNVD